MVRKLRLYGSLSEAKSGEESTVNIISQGTHFSRFFRFVEWMDVVKMNNTLSYVTRVTGCHSRPTGHAHSQHSCHSFHIKTTIS